MYFNVNAGMDGHQGKIIIKPLANQANGSYEGIGIAGISNSLHYDSLLSFHLIVFL